MALSVPLTEKWGSGMCLVPKCMLFHAPTIEEHPERTAAAALFIWLEMVLAIPWKVLVTVDLTLLNVLEVFDCMPDHAD